MTHEYRKHERSGNEEHRRRYRHVYRQLRAKHADLFARRKEFARQTDLGPLHRLAYRTYWAWRPIPATVEKALYGKVLFRERSQPRDRRSPRRHRRPAPLVSLVRPKKGAVMNAESARKRAEVTDEVSKWTVGGGIIAVALFPLAIPIVVLTAVALRAAAGAACRDRGAGRGDRRAGDGRAPPARTASIRAAAEEEMLVDVELAPLDR